MGEKRSAMGRGAVQQTDKNQGTNNKCCETLRPMMFQQYVLSCTRLGNQIVALIAAKADSLLQKKKPKLYCSKKQQYPHEKTVNYFILPCSINAFDTFLYFKQPWDEMQRKVHIFIHELYKIHDTHKVPHMVTFRWPLR